MKGATADSEAKAGLEAATVAEAFCQTVAAHPDRVALRLKGGEQEISFAEYGARVDRFALGLRELGIEKGDTVALMLSNRPEFHIADTAAMSLGATTFSLYQTLTPDQITYQLEDAGARVVVTEPAFLEQVTAARGSVPAVEHVILVDGDGSDEGVVAFEDVLDGDGDTAAVDRARAAIVPEDLLTLIYTSGTTGPPKGVELTHENITAAVRIFDDLVKFPDGARIVSYLPMAHIAERNVGHYLPAALGFTVTCCPNPREVISYLPEVRPSWFFAVPRIWEKLKAGIEAMVESEPDEQRKRAIEQALELGHEKMRREQAGEPVPDELAREYARADDQIFSKLRSQLGLDEAEQVVTGAAPTPMSVLEFFYAIGLPLIEVWGLSETSGTGAASRPGEIKIGAIGRCAPGMEMKLAEDGEVLLRGPTIMRGYRNLPDETAEAIGSDGWFRTGDIGEIDAEGYLKIVDRKKELIITAGAKNVSPANLEAKLKAHPLIGTACVIGDGRRFLSALIVLDPELVPGWASRRSLGELSVEELARRDELRDEVQQAVDRLNQQVSKAEGIKKFTLLAEDWQPGGDELTPTMKLKRKPIEEKYSDQIEAMYAH